MELQDLLDLGRYPIDRPDSPAYARLIGDLRRELEQDGCAVLPGFVHEVIIFHPRMFVQIEFCHNITRGVISKRNVETRKIQLISTI